MSAVVEKVPGVETVDLNFASGTMKVEYAPGADREASIRAAIESTGHGLESLDDEAAGVEPPHRPWIDTYRTEIATAGSGVFALLGLLAGFLGAPDAVPTTLYAVAILFGGLLVWRRALVSLRARMLEMNVLMSIAVFGAALLGEWGEGAMVFFLFALGGLLESRSLERTRRSVRGLMELAPDVARVRRGQGTVEIPASEVVIGDRIVVRPGERIPADATIASGSTAVDESPITGESLPAEKGVDDTVFAGTLNTTGLIEGTVIATSTDSTLAHIVRQVEEAHATRAPTETFIERFTRYYTPVVIVLAALVIVVPPLVNVVSGIDVGPWSEWVRRALILLVVSCPCALVISTPVSIVSGITRASRSGVLVKGGVYLETAAKVKAVAFDKTGTLTTGRPEVVGLEGLGKTSSEEALRIAAALEVHSNHPIGSAIVAAFGDEIGALLQVEGFAERAGRGVRGLVAGVEAEVCSPSHARETAALDAATGSKIESMERLGRTVLVVVLNHEAIGLISVEDGLRPETVEAVRRLKEMGLQDLVMLTGDNEQVGERIAKQAGLTSYLARLLPADKTRAVTALKQRYDVVAMVGDGINDAPALAASDIGIAMGAAGTDTALAAADVALMKDDLSALPGFLALGRRTMRIIRQNIVFSIAIKIIVLVLGLAGKATLWMAVFADTGVSLLVILNGMRLLKAQSDRGNKGA